MAVKTAIPCLAAVEAYPRMAYRSRVVFSERSRPEIFCWVLEGRRSRSAFMRPRVRVSPTRMVMRPPQLSHNLLFAAVFCLFLPWHAEPSGETLPALNAPRS